MFFGGSANETLLDEDDEVVDDRGRDDTTGDGVVEVCDRLRRLVGGACASEDVEDLESEGR